MKPIYYLLFAFVFLAGCEKDSATNSPDMNGSSGSGKGGSLARFTIAKGHLYVVDASKLYSYSLQNPAAPQLIKSVDITNNDVETIYPFNNKLFIGSRTGMYIYSIVNPANPILLGEASHIRACDPVVANSDTIAFVTVRSGTECGSTINALIVYDISNITQPYSITTKNMSSPYGLGIHNSTLYVADGKSGLKQFNISNPGNPVMVATYPEHTFFDVIISDDYLFAMIDGGYIIYKIGEADGLTYVSSMVGI